MSPNSTLLPSVDKRDAELYARWDKIKGGYLDYYNTVRAFLAFLISEVLMTLGIYLYLDPCCVYAVSAVVDDIEYGVAVYQFCTTSA